MKDVKQLKDFLTVAEFAKLSGTTATALRYYDSEGVFLPAKRGKDGNGNYRFYSPSQITTIKLMRVLSEIDVPLTTIKELTENRTPEMLLKLLSKHHTKVTDDIKFLREAFSIIDTFTGLLTEAVCATEDELAVTEMPEWNVILGEENDFTDNTGYMKAFTRFCEAPHEPKLNTSFPIGGYFESMDVFNSNPSQPTRFFSLDSKGHGKKEAGLHLIGYTRGYYGDTKDLPRRMTEFAKKNGLVFTGPVYDIYLTDEISVTDPNQYLQQISVPVRETHRVPSRRSKFRF